MGVLIKDVSTVLKKIAPKKKKLSKQDKKRQFVKALQKSIDNVVPDGYTGTIRTDNMSVYKKDSDKYFKILDQQLKIFGDALKIKQKKQ